MNALSPNLIGAPVAFPVETLPGIAPNPDAELLAIGAELARLYSQIDEINARLKLTDDEETRLRNDRTGFEVHHLDWWRFGKLSGPGIVFWLFGEIERLEPLLPGQKSPYSTLDTYNARVEELKSLNQTWSKRLSDYTRETGRDTLMEQYELLGDEAYELVVKSLGIQATTLAGAQVKARLAKRQNFGWWNKPASELQIEEEIHKSLIDSVLAMEA